MVCTIWMESTGLLPVIQDSGVLLVWGFWLCWQGHPYSFKEEQGRVSTGGWDKLRDGDFRVNPEQLLPGLQQTLSCFATLESHCLVPVHQRTGLPQTLQLMIFCLGLSPCTGKGLPWSISVQLWPGFPRELVYCRHRSCWSWFLQELVYCGHQSGWSRFPAEPVYHGHTSGWSRFLQELMYRRHPCSSGNRCTSDTSPAGAGSYGNWCTADTLLAGAGSAGNRCTADNSPAGVSASGNRSTLDSVHAGSHSPSRRGATVHIRADSFPQKVVRLMCNKTTGVCYIKQLFYWRL